MQPYFLFIVPGENCCYKYIDLGLAGQPALKRKWTFARLRWNPFS